MADTLLLDIDAWDLVLDSIGNIAVASEPYSMAQDAASYCRLFQGELWFDTTKGVPYLTEILARSPSLPLLKSAFVTAALQVPDVVSAVCYITGVEERLASGQIQVTNSSGQTQAANF